MKIQLAFVGMVVGFIFTTSNFYSLQFQDVTGISVPMSQFQGKKILLVNIATGSSRVNQLAELQQLNEQYHDSLVVIAFPSNSFGNEQRADPAIKNFCQHQYGVTFPIASKNPVTGPQIQTVYYWLTSFSENNVIGDHVKGDFQKFMISSDGVIIGIFSPSVSPLSNELTRLITN